MFCLEAQSLKNGCSEPTYLIKCNKLVRLDVKDGQMLAKKSQTLFCYHKRHMFIANLNDNNDSLIGKFAWNRLNR